MNAWEPCRRTVVVYGPIDRSDLPGLCARVRAFLAESDTRLVICDVATVTADAVSVDALARLQLGAQRHGRQVRLRNASAELRQLVGFMGLTDVLPD
jgi:ABC-type transporter Mla MlaB component